MFKFEAIKQAKSQSEIPTDNTEDGVPYIVQSMFNNMVSRTVNKKWLIDNNEAPVSGNRIVLGVTLPAVSYQPKEFGASQVITAKADWLNEQNGIFISIAISKLMYQFSYNRKPGMQIYKDMVINLPTKNGKIDFDFIESFISELEAERIADLEAYLTVTGLKDYTLTVEERKVLENFETEKIEFGDFEIQTLFAVSPSKAYAMNDEKILVENGKTPYVSNQSQNNGYIGWSNLAPLNPSNVITLSDTWQSERTIFYQATEFIGKSHLQVMKAYDTKFQKLELFYVISSFRKAILEIKYDYGTKFNRGKINTTKIQLPVVNNEIDFTFMKTFISAIQKLVIKDLVLYVDKKTDATKA